jgi:hypothetical protein
VSAMTAVHPELRLPLSMQRKRRKVRTCCCSPLPRWLASSSLTETVSLSMETGKCEHDYKIQVIVNFEI